MKTLRGTVKRHLRNVEKPEYVSETSAWIQNETKYVAHSCRNYLLTTGQRGPLPFGYLAAPSIDTRQTRLDDVVVKVLYQGIIWEYFLIRCLKLCKKHQHLL